MSTETSLAEGTLLHSGDHLQLVVYQRDWMPGFAGFVHKPKQGDPLDGAHIVLNIGAFMACVADGDIAPSELPYFIAESLMHEVIHALEAWARVEFSEDRVEALITRYREYHAALEAEHGHAASSVRDGDGDPD